MIVLRYESLDNSCFQKTRRTGGGGGGGLGGGGGGGGEFVGWGN